MRLASGEFAEDPCSSVKRGNMVRAARALLSAVTHLLVLADMSDVYKLLLQLKLVRWNWGGGSLLHVQQAFEIELGLQKEYPCCLNSAYPAFNPFWIAMDYVLFRKTWAKFLFCSLGELVVDSYKSGITNVVGDLQWSLRMQNKSYCQWLQSKCHVPNVTN